MSSKQLVRAIWGVIDPRSVRGIMPRGAEVFLYFVPLVLFFEINFIHILLWYIYDF